MALKIHYEIIAGNGASEKELSEMQIQLVETINELDKTRNLLR